MPRGGGVNHDYTRKTFPPHCLRSWYVGALCFHDDALRLGGGGFTMVVVLIFDYNVKATEYVLKFFLFLQVLTLTSM